MQRDRCVVTLAVSSGKRNVMVWRPSVCPSVPSAYSPCHRVVAHQGTACDAASVHFGPTLRTTDKLVYQSSLTLAILNVLKIELGILKI